MLSSVSVHYVCRTYPLHHHLSCMSSFLSSVMIFHHCENQAYSICWTSCCFLIILPSLSLFLPSLAWMEWTCWQWFFYHPFSPTTICLCKKVWMLFEKQQPPYALRCKSKPPVHKVTCGKCSMMWKPLLVEITLMNPASEWTVGLNEERW